MSRKAARRRQDAPKDPYSLPNPKDAIAGLKVPLDLVPDSIEVLASLASLEGALKYGKFNYRARPVRMSVYLAALKRHCIRMNNGEWCDRKTKVPHISNILKCAIIIGDAWLNGTLIDDRPPHNKGLLDFMDTMEPKIKHLQRIFKEHNPTQYTNVVLLEERRRALSYKKNDHRQRQRRRGAGR